MLSTQSCTSRRAIESRRGRNLPRLSNRARSSTVYHWASPSSSSFRTMSKDVAVAWKPSISDDGNGKGCDE